MMYVNKIVATLKINDRFLRDDKGVYKVPFGSEYKIYLKNIESRDAAIKIEIDGKDVLGGNQLILRANSWWELDGFIEGNSVTNKFKFIEFTKEIENHIGYNPEYSLIKIEARFVKPKPIEIIYKYTYINPEPHWYSVYWNSSGGTQECGSTNSIRGSCSTNKSVDDPNTIVCAAAGGNFTPSNENDLGITVKGDYSDQKLYNAYIGDLEDTSTVLVLKLSGYKENTDKVKNYITTKERLTCSSCGLKSNSSFKFCPRCGTFLE